jgi:hypothetical protein
MADAPTTPPTTDADAAAATAHLAHLHKMSTTAGVTNLDYVAVSPLAVASVLIAIASLLALVGPVFLMIPAAGVLVAVLALRQIADSSGTQTGRPLAWISLALCVVIGGAEVAKESMAALATRSDEQRIAATLNDLGAAIKAQNYKDAYALFDDEFQDRVKLKAFSDTWSAVQAPNGLGKLESLAWNGVKPQFVPSGGSRGAYVKALVKFARSNEERFDVALRQVGDRWMVTQLPAFFPMKGQRGGNTDEDVFQIPER